MRPKPAVPVAVASPPLWRRALPWLVAAVLLVAVFSRVNRRALGDALLHVDALSYFVFIACFSVANLVCEVLATSYAYRITVAPVRFSTLLVVRAASYVPSAIHFHIGQAYLTFMLSRVYGAPLRRVAGGTLFVYATTFGSLVLVAAAALPLSHGAYGWLSRTVAALVGTGVAYLALVAAKPRVLASRAAIAPLFDAGVGGHVRAVLFRMPHMLVQFAGIWLAYRFFGVRIPLLASLAYVPVLMLVSALPITPGGVGTRDVLALDLLARYAPTGGAAGPPILAAGLVWAVATIGMSAALGSLFLGCSAYHASTSRRERPEKSRVRRRYKAAARSCVRA